MTKRVLLSAALAASLAGSACAMRSPNIADVQRNPSRYADRTVLVDGVVTTSWGVPLVPFKFYKIDDGTGELTVVGRGSYAPARGARVRVKGRVNEVATLGGRPIGLHLEERDLDVKRQRRDAVVRP